MGYSPWGCIASYMTKVILKSLLLVPRNHLPFLQATGQASIIQQIHWSQRPSLNYSGELFLSTGCSLFKHLFGLRQF